MCRDGDLPSQRESALLPNKQRDAIPREMIRKMLERFPEGHSSHLPIMLAYHCGLRKGEVFGLSWDVVDKFLQHTSNLRGIIT